MQKGDQWANEVGYLVRRRELKRAGVYERGHRPPHESLKTEEVEAVFDSCDGQRIGALGANPGLESKMTNRALGIRSSYEGRVVDA